MGELRATLSVGSRMWEVTTGCESCGMEGARLRCPWAAARPGRTTSRRAKPHVSTPDPTGVKGAGGTEGPGRGAGGRRQGQGGPRDRPLRAVRLACGDLAGGPPPTGTHSGPAHKSRRGAHNTRGATSNTNNRTSRRPPAHTAAQPIKATHAAAGDQARPQAAQATPARHSKRGRHQPTPCASALTRP